MMININWEKTLSFWNFEKLLNVRDSCKRYYKMFSKVGYGSLRGEYKKIYEILNAEIHSRIINREE
jgi:hypothetical protein